MLNVLVTGAGRGVGRATALQLAARGHRVVATARDIRTLDDLPIEDTLRLDVTDQESIDAAFAAAGELDVVVNNAAVALVAAAETTPPDDLSNLLEVNVVGQLRVVQAALPTLKRNGGRLVFVTSRAVLPLAGAFTASKWALSGLAEALAFEVAHFGVSTTLVEPGYVATDHFDQITPMMNDDYVPLAKQLVAPASVTPGEVAGTIADAVEAENVPLRIAVGEFAMSPQIEW